MKLALNVPTGIIHALVNSTKADRSDSDPFHRSSECNFRRWTLAMAVCEG